MNCPDFLIARREPASGTSADRLHAANIHSIAIVTADAETLISFRGYLIDELLTGGISVYYVGPEPDAATRKWLAARSIPIKAVPIDRNTLAPAADLRTLLALWSAARGVKALFMALNIASGEEEKRSFLLLNAQALAMVVAGSGPPDRQAQVVRVA